MFLGRGTKKHESAASRSQELAAARPCRARRLINLVHLRVRHCSTQAAFKLPSLVQEVTETVINAIISNGAMKVVGESQSDAVVYGTIVNVRDEADTYSSSEQAKQFKIRIFADVRFFDRRKNKALWEEKGLEGWARYDASSSSTREDAKTEALKMLAGLIIDKTVAGW